MNKEKYLEEIEGLRENIGPWKIVLNEYTRSNFMIGYYLSGEANEYIVYKNDEYGRQSVVGTTGDELEALETILKMMKTL